MRKAIAAAGVLGLLVVAGGLGFEAYADRQIKQALDAWRAELPAGTELSYGRIEAAGADGAVLHAVRFRTDRMPQPVAVRAERLRIEEVTFDGDLLRRVGQFDFQDAVVESLGGTLRVADGDGRDVGFTDDYRVRAVGEARLSDLDVADAQGTASAERVTLLGLDAGRLRRLEIQALAVAQRAQGAGGAIRRVLVDRLRVRDADVDDLRRLNGRTAAPDPAQVVAALRGDGIGQIGLNGLEVIEQGRRIAALQAMQLSLATPKDGAITFDMSYTGGYADASHPRAGYPMLAALGYQELRGDGGLRLSYHPEAGSFALERLEMDLSEVAQLSLTGRVVGIPAVAELAQQLERDPRALQAQAALQGFTLRLQNRGVASRLVEMRAQRTGQSPETVRRNQAQMIRQTAREMQLAELGEPIARFVEQAGTLTLTAKPSRPVTFREIRQLGLGEPQRLRETLNLQAARGD
ncbi:hypothetical protein CKO28_10670 [Rhodovibrio sodomensis]|uniref:DUF945 domain-containing protein n=1 Tax=Rhodovibrio sodomensis TaxID=1088 RepID=A0ABS1DEX3_9PROT|nr:hypothetical protein [Rhodovibrio sodomensis]MBK1668496.1 hypothetical protein [Rhodovibrio sodomensis]